MPASRDENEILRVIWAESAAFFRGDYEELARHWLQTPQARRVFSGVASGTRTQNGWDQISAGFRAAIACRDETADIDDVLERRNVQLCVSHDMAWVHYDQILRKRAPGVLARDLQHEIKVLHRVDGAWKIACMVLIAPTLPDGQGARIFLGRDGRISAMNADARARIDDHPGLRVAGERLVARNRSFDAGLQREIGHRLERLKTLLPPEWMNMDVQAVPLGTDDHARPLYCWVHAEQDNVVVSFDEDAQIEARLDVAARTYGLSPAQRRVAGLLAQGEDVAGAAGRLGVKPNTVRTQIRRMFDKTGTRNQATLITALLSVQPPG